MGFMDRQREIYQQKMAEMHRLLVPGEVLYGVIMANHQKMMSAKSLEKAIEVQTGYAKDAYEGFVSQATKMGDMYADMAKEAYKPFESMMAKAK